MAEISFKILSDLFGKGTKQTPSTIARILWRLAGAITMASLLVLNQPRGFNPIVVGGVFILSLVAGLMMRAHLITLDHDEDIPTRRNHERLVWITSLLAVAGVQVANLSIAPESFDRVGLLLLAPLVAQAMLTAALVTPSVALVSLTMSALLLGIPGVVPMQVLIVAWLSGAVSTHLVNPLKQRSDLLRAMTIQIGAQAIIAAAMVAVTQGLGTAILESVVWATISTVIAVSIFWLGVAVFEKLFGIVSDWTLLELCSPENPLLKELVIRAPGTWAHSVGVANLAESAAREIGANAILCRTMAYYHDIGKSIRPNFFVENQIGENVHDELTPGLSAQVITAHTTDGVKMARKAKLPQIIIDGIEQHHGTSLITFFYHRAQQASPETPPLELEKKFRYAGPKPQTKEVAVLHLADIIEAASRAITTAVDTEDFVRNLIEKSRADGQLDEADLTFRELQQIQNSFVRSLSAIRHERVAYPTLSKENDNQASTPGITQLPAPSDNDQDDSQNLGTESSSS